MLLLKTLFKSIDTRANCFEECNLNSVRRISKKKINKKNRKAKSLQKVNPSKAKQKID